jgi:N utilization substance protein A
MKNEFVLAFNEVLEEKQLPKDIIMDALQAAMVSAYRRAVNASNAQHVDAVIDPETGKVMIYAEKEVVDAVQDTRTEVALEEALQVDPTAQLGGMVIVESTPQNFGRVAAQTARQVIQQRIREAERDAQFGHFSRQMGEIMSGVVQAVNAQGVTLGLDMKAEGIMPRNQQIPGERFRVHDRVRALLVEVKISPRGPQIILSRAHRNFLRRLLENEVPEIYHGMVEIRSIAREPGQRSKVAVAALQPGVDPVGACVGIRGVRIQAIVRELNDEKIDVIEWSPDAAVYIAKALSPARVSGVYLNDLAKGAKTATVVVPEDQLSLAIGRDGQNARLAAKLTGWRIDIKSLPEAAGDALHRIRNDAEYIAMAAHESDLLPTIEVILAKKAEGRPVTPEEYQVLTQFVDRVERNLIRQRQSEKQVEDERLLEARSHVPALAFEIPMEDFQVADRVYAVISEAGFTTVGDLMLQMELDPDAILKLAGMGPKGMKELGDALEAVREQARQQEAAALGEIAEAVAEEVGPSEAAAEPIAEAGVLAVAEEAAEAEAGEAQPVEAFALPEESFAIPVEAPVSELESVTAAAEAAINVEEEEETSLDKLFTLSPDALVAPESSDEEEEDESGDKKKKKKKKKYVEMEYDPEADFLVVTKKRKRGDQDW